MSHLAPKYDVSKARWAIHLPTTGRTKCASDPGGVLSVTWSSCDARSITWRNFEPRPGQAGIVFLSRFTSRMSPDLIHAHTLPHELGSERCERTNERVTQYIPIHGVIKGYPYEFQGKDNDTALISTFARWQQSVCDGNGDHPDVVGDDSVSRVHSGFHAIAKPTTVTKVGEGGGENKNSRKESKSTQRSTRPHQRPSLLKTILTWELWFDGEWRRKSDERGPCHNWRFVLGRRLPIAPSPAPCPNDDAPKAATTSPTHARAAFRKAERSNKNLFVLRPTTFIVTRRRILEICDHYLHRWWASLIERCRKFLILSHLWQFYP